MAKISLISQKYLFWDYSKWLQIKQSVPGLNWSLSLNIWWLRSVKFNEECVMNTEKHVLVNNVYKWAKHEFATTILSQNDNPWRRNTQTFQ